jgi:3-oxoacyl-ACP reductase-like protein
MAATRTRNPFRTRKSEVAAGLRACAITGTRHSESLERKQIMMSDIHKTVIVTGGSRGIGAGLVKAFLDRGHNVVATSRSITKTGGFIASEKLELVDGSIADPATATRIVETAKRQFGAIDALVNNAK